jgi:tetratricopeptide (TPR) repeat protein
VRIPGFDMHLDVFVSTAGGRRGNERFVCDDFLSTRTRVVRWELARWCATIGRALDRISADVAHRLSALSTCFHDAGRIAEHLGHAEDARRLSRAAIRFFARTGERTGSSGATALALSALIDLGRIERGGGRPEEALLHLGRVRSLGLGAEIGGGTLRVSRAQWERLMADDPLSGRAIAAEAAAEMLATLLSSRRLEEALALALMAKRGPCDPPELEWVRREAALSALCRLGRAEEALSLAARCTVESPKGQRLVFDLRRAEALACFGDVQRARGLAVTVLSALDRKWQILPASLDDLRMGARASALGVALGDPLTADFCWTALAEALSLGDVLLESELLLRIVEADWHEERQADAADLLRAVARGSGYRLPAIERLMAPEDGPLSSRPPEERAPGFGTLVQALTALDPTGTHGAP